MCIVTDRGVFLSHYVNTIYFTLYKHNYVSNDRQPFHANHFSSFLRRNKITPGSHHLRQTVHFYTFKLFTNTYRTPAATLVPKEQLENARMRREASVKCVRQPGMQQ